MKIEQQFSEPETTPDRHAYRLRIEAKNGDVIEVTEQMTGGFNICVRSSPGRMVIWPVDINNVIIEVK